MSVCVLKLKTVLSSEELSGVKIHVGKGEGKVETVRKREKGRGKSGRRDVLTSMGGIELYIK